jgi:PKD repeat protein
MSLGAPGVSSDPATDAAIEYAWNAGVVILAATGNENNSEISYPAIHDLVIGVGAASPCGERKRSAASSLYTNPGVYTDPNDYTCDGERWWGSNYGSTTQDDRGAVDIIAPTIMPTTDIGGSGGYAPGDYDMWFNGTSCSTPYAAGVTGLIIAANPGFTAQQVWDRLTGTAQDVVSVESGSGWDRYTGYGMVDAAAAVGGGGPVAPVAAFSGAPVSGNYPLLVNFTDQSSGTPTSWAWDFGDGGTSTAQNPSYTYNAVGTYTVSLTVSNAVGSDVETKTGYITVTEPGATIVSTALADLPSLGTVSGTYANTWAADGTSQVITETLSDNHPRKKTSWLEHAWRFDVAAGSSVDFKLRASGGSGDGDTFAFAWSTDQATWNALVTVSSSTMQDYTVAMPSNTSGTVYVRVIDTNRVWDATVLDAVTVDFLAFESGDAQPQAPVADFTGAPTSGDYPLTVNFTDQSSGTPTSWAWTFGDGGTSTAQNPSHTYTVAGTYTVSLTATNDVGSDTVTKTDYITVTEPGTGGDTMHVASLVVTRKVAGPNINGVGTVTIRDSGGAPVANATVTMVVTGPTSGTYSALTDATGTATVSTAKVKNPSGEWCFEVTDVTHATLTYDAGSNVVTKACESGTVFRAGAERMVAGLTASPNPFNPATEIQFGIGQAGRVQLQVYDVRGRLVATLLDEVRSVGTHSVQWRPSSLASGVYYARMITPEGVLTQRLLLLK